MKAAMQATTKGAGPQARWHAAWAPWAHELRLLRRSRMAVAALVLLALLTALAVASGLREVQRQQASIARALQLQQGDLAEQAARVAAGRDAGASAYYTFHSTYDPPAPASFLALGLRDASPHVLRVRALALQAQLHEGETHNPELALLGRLDFAFVLVYLAPLFLIALMYDLVSAERAAGRLGSLLALPGGQRLWLRRAALRAGLVFAALALPVLAGAWASAWAGGGAGDGSNGGVPGMSAGVLGLVLVVTAAYALFWAALALWVAGRGWPSATNAVALVGCWAVLTLVLPTLVQLGITRAVPAHQGAELMLAQREAVHGAWDQPREATLQRFFQTHPEWRDTAPLPTGFHWKWYYAFQQLGDESVAPQAAAYRQALLQRQQATVWAGALLPGVAVQTALHRAAETDLIAQLAYQDAIARFHERLRRQLYPQLFHDQPFGVAGFGALPRFEPAPRGQALADAAVLALGLGPLLGLALLLAKRGLQRVQPVAPTLVAR
jgi:ABC-2 type transport system permease protein